MTTIAQELGDVLRLLEKATPGPWNYSEKGFSKTPMPTVYATGQDLNYIAMCRDFGNVGPTLNEENAEAIAAAVNFLRTHSAEIAGALRDAERLDALERLLESTHDGMILLHNGNGAGRGITGLGLQNTGRSLRQAIDDSAMQQGGGHDHTLDAAIDAAMTATGGG